MPPKPIKVRRKTAQSPVGASEVPVNSEDSQEEYNVPQPKVVKIKTLQKSSALGIDDMPVDDPPTLQEDEVQTPYGVRTGRGHGREDVKLPINTSATLTSPKSTPKSTPKPTAKESTQTDTPKAPEAPEASQVVASSKPDKPSHPSKPVPTPKSQQEPASTHEQSAVEFISASPDLVRKFINETAPTIGLSFTLITDVDGPYAPNMHWQVNEYEDKDAYLVIADEPFMEAPEPQYAFQLPVAFLDEHNHGAADFEVVVYVRFAQKKERLNKATGELEQINMLTGVWAIHIQDLYTLLGMSYEPIGDACVFDVRDLDCYSVNTLGKPLQLVRI